MSTELEKYITNIPDFPKPGVSFKDISPLLKYKLNETIEEMSKGIDWNEVDHVIGIESRGFILGVALAQMHNKGFIPVRKKSNLPPPVISEEYTLEYGTDILEMHPNDEPTKVVVVDDVLATGGTMKAVIKMCQKNNYDIQNIAVLINLGFLNKFKEEGIKYNSVLEY